MLFRSMACPALPTCGLAITESERVLPSVLDRIHQLLTKLDMANEPLVIRMTGCPNGCVRPYLAELGLVGSGLAPIKSGWGARQRVLTWPSPGNKIYRLTN